MALPHGAVGSSAVCNYDYTSLDVTNILPNAWFLFDSLRNFLPLRPDILLFGNPNLTDAENKIIFESVHIFIKTSTRFN